MNLDSLLHPRRLMGAAFACCAGLLGFGLYLQHALGLEPCPLCILQRYAFVAAGVVGLAAALHGPRGRAGQRTYAALLAVTALAGLGVAARQVWLQHNPPPVAECGPGLEYMLEAFPLTQLLPALFQGSGDCAKVVWTFLGLSIPEWSLACFLGLAGIGLLVFLRAGPGRA
jgi:disulfide bond formation protein DsbB